MRLKIHSQILTLWICLFTFAAQAYPVNRSATTSSLADANINKTETTSSTTVSPVGAAFKCKSSAECNDKGICNVRTGMCDCFPYYIEQDCSYKEIQQLAAFIMHFFLGMPLGAGHFYVADNIIATGELALFWGSIILVNIGQHAGTRTGKFVTDIGAFGLLGSVGWWLADTIRFGMNVIPDKNGKALHAW